MVRTRTCIQSINLVYNIFQIYVALFMLYILYISSVVVMYNMHYMSIKYILHNNYYCLFL